MDIANYLYNQFQIMRNGLTYISKKTWIKIKQSLEYVEIFGSMVNIFIPNKKEIKSDIRKT